MPRRLLFTSRLCSDEDRSDISVYTSDVLQPFGVVDETTLDWPRDCRTTRWSTDLKARSRMRPEKKSYPR